MSYLFTSERLGFRNWEEKDRIPFRKLNANAEVMRYFPSIKTDEESDALFERLKKHFTQEGKTFYVVELLERPVFVGFLGLIDTQIRSFFTPCVEIGWRFNPFYWNKGLATEGARVCIAYAWEVLELESIVSYTPQVNKPSERVMQKIGMRHLGFFNHPSIAEGSALSAHTVYIIDRP